MALRGIFSANYFMGKKKNKSKRAKKKTAKPKDYYKGKKIKTGLKAKTERKDLTI